TAPRARCSAHRLSLTDPAGTPELLAISHFAPSYVRLPFRHRAAVKDAAMAQFQSDKKSAGHTFTRLTTDHCLSKVLARPQIFSANGPSLSTAISALLVHSGSGCLFKNRRRL